MSQRESRVSRIAALPKTGRAFRPIHWFFSLSVLAFLVLACTTNAVPAELPDTPVVVEAPQPNLRPIADSNVMEQLQSDAVPAGVSGPELNALDPNAIVAAYEAVLSGIYDRSVPSVVRIRSVRQLGQSSNLPDLPGFPDFRHSGGSGFVWDDQGRIVTNHHVIDGAERVIVIFSDGTELDAEVLGSDPDSDLAVLQVEDTDHPMPPIQIGDSSAVRAGQLATAIGNPFGQEFTITSGIISAVGRTIRTGNSQFSIPQVLQTDAPINPGNSGGPLLDRKGMVIGVTTQIISNNGANSGIGFAVPINTAKRVIPALIKDGFYEYAWLGISGATLTAGTAEMMGLPRDTKGTLVIDVAEGGPAAEGGIQSSDTTTTVEGINFRLGGDVIVALNGEPIDGINQLIIYLIEHTRPGDEAEIKVLREGESGQTTETLTVTLGKRPGL